MNYFMFNICMVNLISEGMTHLVRMCRLYLRDCVFK